MWSFLSGRSNSTLHSIDFPLQALQDAISTGNESNVWKVLRQQRIRNELIHSTTTHKVPRDAQQQKCNVFTCVQAAVQENLPRVVLAMYRFNQDDVRLATWYALYRLKSDQKVKL
ncbi:hypothetical protein F441_02898 [Phytophthora nicotianae CJ01A1]|nr:hypothetical protein F443_02923 [Phytophthora nicotianae P1569]ETK94108.1 hypothetical protein L915_02791 [Phytophthora nicotianae]ETO82985.1 hypothetical protein F444_02934 [Phytophthora nicotianae P1976]ETP24059.1 hypothetical protein F441_02898 [Phytophthora nicotianae CJ01A1]ETP52073.1 hypothetical protein F442_02870 [Phytophthora nicotianae P10297]